MYLSYNQHNSRSSVKTAMSYTFVRQPDSPIIVFTEHPNGGDPMQDVPAAIAEAARLLDQQPSPVFLVFDLREVSIGLHDIMSAASMGARGQNAVLHHPMIRENVYVTTDPKMKMAIQGLATATFGFVRLSRFDTLEEALEYCDHGLREASRKHEESVEA